VTLLFPHEGALLPTECQLFVKGIQAMSLTNILWAVIVILFVLWLLGWLVGNVGSFIHILLVLAILVLLYNLFVGMRRGGV
jgi:hypothetical protein